jgi:ribonuclease HII
MTAPSPAPDSLLSFEERYWQEGCVHLAGIDEAGRGPLAGPVVAAAVILEREFVQRECTGGLAGLNDSKKLTAKRREHFHDLLMRSPHVHIGVGLVTCGEIDAINILQATHLAMAKAVADLSVVPDLALVDGNPVSSLPCKSMSIVQGDSRSLSIAAASVIAKVVRDDHMLELDQEYPVYGFAAHKGYGTSRHMQALYQHGPCPQHRRSFRPVREAYDIRRRMDGA